MNENANKATSVDPADRWSIMVERCTPHTFIFTATPILPRASIVSQPLHDTHRVGVESLTEPHVEHCITHTQRARARAVKETREMETGAKPVESIRVVRKCISLYDRKMLNRSYDSQLCIPLVASNRF